MARKAKRQRKAPAATSSRGTTDRDKAIDALMSLLADHSFEQIGLAEVAGQAGIKLSQLRAEFGSTLAILAPISKPLTAQYSRAAPTTWPRSPSANGCLTY